MTKSIRLSRTNSSLGGFREAMKSIQLEQEALISHQNQSPEVVQKRISYGNPNPNSHATPDLPTP